MTDQPSPVLKALGWMLTVLGGLWLALTGGCTLLFAGASVWSLITSHNDGGMLAVSLFVGAVCVAPGIVMFWGGRTILRAQAPRSTVQSETD
jgi:hypothetical protein